MGLFGSVKAEAKYASVRQRELVEFRLRRLSSLVTLVNRMADECNQHLRTACGAEWLVVGEDFDKQRIPVAKAEALFITYGDLLFRDLDLHAIFTLPISLAYSTLGAQLPLPHDRIHCLPDTPVFDKHHDAHVAGREALAEVLEARVAGDLFEAGQRQRLIVASGGNLRDLLSMVVHAAEDAQLDGRARIAAADVDAARVKLRTEYERRLGESPYDHDKIGYEEKARRLVAIYQRDPTADVPDAALHALLRARAPCKSSTASAGSGFIRWSSTCSSARSRSSRARARSGCVVAPPTLEPGGPDLAVVHRLASWAARAPKGLALVSYDSAEVLGRTLDALRDALAPHAVPLHEIALRVGLEPARLVDELVARLEGLTPGAVSITGWGTAFDHETSLADALHLAPDLWSWFLVRVDLREAPTEAASDELEVAAQLRRGVLLADLALQADARRARAGAAPGARAERLAERFERALAAGADVDELRDLGWRALAELYSAHAPDDARAMVARLNAAAREAGRPPVVPDVAPAPAFMSAARESSDARTRADRVASDEPLLADLVAFLACLAPLPVPEELLLMGARALGQRLGSAVALAESRARLRSAAAAAGLVRHDAHGQWLLLLAAGRDIGARAPDAQAWAARAVEAVTRAVSHFAWVIPDSGARLEPHVVACCGRVEAQPEAVGELASALQTRAVELREMGQRERSVAVLRQVVAVRRRLSSYPADRQARGLASALHELCLSLSRAGHSQEALEAIREATRLRRLALSHDKEPAPSLADSLLVLSEALTRRGQREEALDTAAEAVRIYRAWPRLRGGFDVDAGLARSVKALSAGLMHYFTEAEALERPTSARSRRFRGWTVSDSARGEEVLRVVLRDMPMRDVRLLREHFEPDVVRESPRSADGSNETRSEERLRELLAAMVAAARRLQVGPDELARALSQGAIGRFFPRPRDG